MPESSSKNGSNTAESVSSKRRVPISKNFVQNQNVGKIQFSNKIEYNENDGNYSDNNKSYRKWKENKMQNKIEPESRIRTNDQNGKMEQHMGSEQQKV